MKTILKERIIVTCLCFCILQVKFIKSCLCLDPVVVLWQHLGCKYLGSTVVVYIGNVCTHTGTGDHTKPGWQLFGKFSGACIEVQVITLPKIVADVNIRKHISVNI